MNLEARGLPLAHSVHAEQFLIALAAQQSEPSLLALAVTDAPCGHCRQFASELNCAAELRFIFQGGVAQALPALLPRRFGPHDLTGPGAAPALLLDPCDVPLELDGEATAALAGRPGLGPAAAAA